MKISKVETLPEARLEKLRQGTNDYYQSYNQLKKRNGYPGTPELKEVEYDGFGNLAYSFGSDSEESRYIDAVNTKLRFQELVDGLKRYDESARNGLYTIYKGFKGKEGVAIAPRSDAQVPVGECALSSP